MGESVVEIQILQYISPQFNKYAKRMQGQDDKL
jgi:hypothetical protein